jgi:hypothetical protein
MASSPRRLPPLGSLKRSNRIWLVSRQPGIEQAPQQLGGFAGAARIRDQAAP